MTTERRAGAWYQIKGEVNELWDKRLSEDLEQIEGHAE
jgi:uncharacterized protein YjbJ (UPF0337 family)